MKLKEGAQTILAKRFLYSVYMSMTKYVDIKLKDDSTCEGILFAVDKKTSQILIKNFYNHADEATKIDKMRKLNLSDIKYIVAKNLEKPGNEKIGDMAKEKAKHNFEIDTMVGERKNKKGDKKKKFIKWDEQTDQSTGFFGQEPKNMMALDSLDSKEKDFDQMKFNEENFGIMDDYDETNYTTELKLDEYTKEEIEMANKIAESIEKSDLRGLDDNRHMKEERGLVGLRDNEDDVDEEALYSAVVRPGGDKGGQKPKLKLPEVNKENLEMSGITVSKKKSKKKKCSFKFKKIQDKDKGRTKKRFISFCCESWSKEFGLEKRKKEKEAKTMKPGRKFSNSEMGFSGASNPPPFNKNMDMSNNFTNTNIPFQGYPMNNFGMMGDYQNSQNFIGVPQMNQFGGMNMNMGMNMGMSNMYMNNMNNMYMNNMYINNMNPGAMDLNMLPGSRGGGTPQDLHLSRGNSGVGNDGEQRKGDGRGGRKFGGYGGHKRHHNRNGKRYGGGGGGGGNGGGGYRGGYRKGSGQRRKYS